VRAVDPERLCKDVGRRIAELRRERRLTQEALAARLGTTFQWVSKLEAGRNLTLYSLVRVSNALKVSLADLLVRPRKPDAARKPGRPRHTP
jgi:transcriptional regulator with XRE-family HTH domain